jgi:hypothetical protein
MRLNKAALFLLLSVFAVPAATQARIQQDNPVVRPVKEGAVRTAQKFLARIFTLGHHGPKGR